MRGTMRSHSCRRTPAGSARLQPAGPFEGCQGWSWAFLQGSSPGAASGSVVARSRASVMCRYQPHLLLGRFESTLDSPARAGHLNQGVSSEQRCVACTR